MQHASQSNKITPITKISWIDQTLAHLHIFDIIGLAVWILLLIFKLEWAILGSFVIITYLTSYSFYKAGIIRMGIETVTLSLLITGYYFGLSEAVVMGPLLIAVYVLGVGTLNPTLAIQFFNFSLLGAIIFYLSSIGWEFHVVGLFMTVYTTTTGLLFESLTGGWNKMWYIFNGCINLLFYWRIVPTITGILSLGL